MLGAPIEAMDSQRWSNLIRRAVGNHYRNASNPPPRTRFDLRFMLLLQKKGTSQTSTTSAFSLPRFVPRRLCCG